MNQSKNFVFMTRKDFTFYNQTLQSVAISLKKLKIFICIFSTMILLSSKIFSIVIFYSAVAFQRQNLLNPFKKF